MNSRKIIVIALVVSVYALFFAMPSFADDLLTTAMADMWNGIQNVTDDWVKNACGVAASMLALTAVIGFMIGVKDLVMSGQLSFEGIVSLLVRYTFIIGIPVWLLVRNKGIFLSHIPDEIVKLSEKITGVPPIEFGTLLEQFFNITQPIVAAMSQLKWYDFALILYLTIVVFMINILFALMATTLLVIHIEILFIAVGGMMTASFFVIGYFRDYFISYIKALVAAGFKLLMLNFAFAIMYKIMENWPAKIAAASGNLDGYAEVLTPFTTALLVFYVIIKACPQFVSSLMTGSASGLDGGAVKSAAVAGIAAAMTVINASKKTATAAKNVAGTVSEAASAFTHTAQAARDTGSTPGQAKRAGAKEAFKTLMLGPRPGGPQAAAGRIYAAYEQAHRGANTMDPPKGEKGDRGGKGDKGDKGDRDIFNKSKDGEYEK